MVQGRLDELMSQMRMQNQIGATLRPDVAYHIDVNVQHEIKQVATLLLLFFRSQVVSIPGVK